MPASLDDRLIVAISSRALFDLDEGHAIYVRDGVDAYTARQIPYQDAPFSLQPEQPVIEVILLSRNSADTGLRVFSSIRHHRLQISRAAFTRGESTLSYASAFGANLSLSVDPEDVREVLAEGRAAACAARKYH